MIQHEKTDSGGSVRVKSKDGFAAIHFQYSNSDSPLSLWSSVSAGSNPRIAISVIESLCERYDPVVIVVESDQTEIRYIPKIGPRFRCWTHGNQSVLAEAFSSRDMFNRVCSLSYAMQNTDFVTAETDELKFYGYRQVLGKIRQNTSPFEFLSIKEECDHDIKKTSTECVDRIVSGAVDALPSVPSKMRKQFEAALDKISHRQLGEKGFDTRYSYIQEITTAVLLPAVVKLGSNNAFTQSVFKEFSDSAAQYISVCENFLREYGEIDGLNS